MGARNNWTTCVPFGNKSQVEINVVIDCGFFGGVVSGLTFHEEGMAEFQLGGTFGHTGVEPSQHTIPTPFPVVVQLGGVIGMLGDIEAISQQVNDKFVQCETPKLYHESIGV